MADERYRDDNYGQADSGRRSSRGRSQDVRSRRTADHDVQDRYPSGRPKTQPYGTADSYAGQPEGDYRTSRNQQAGSQRRARYDEEAPSSYRASTGSYGQRDGVGSRQGSYSQTPSYIQRGRYGQQGGYGEYGEPGYGRSSMYAQDSDRRCEQDGRAPEDRYGEGEGWYERSYRPGYDDRRGVPQQKERRDTRSGVDREATAAPNVALPEPIAQLLDRLQANPVLLAAIVGGVALIIVVALVASCVAGNAQQGYVQAESSQGADASGSSQSTSGSSEPTYSGTASAGATSTGDTADETAATAGTDSAQTTTDAHDQTPHDVDDVTTIAKEDVWSYSTTSFNKDAAYNSGGVEDPWSPTGYFTTGDSELDQMVKAYCDGQTQSGLDAGDNAYYTYLHISWIDYVEDDQNQRPWDVQGDWRVTYAKQCFTKMTANCYEFAAAVQYIMRYYGYADAIAEPCLVLKQSGAWGDHGLVFLTSLDGRQCLIDTSLSSNGWLLPATSMTYTLDNGYRAS